MIFILYICLHKKRQNASCSFECENRVSTEKRQEMGEGRSESGQWRLLVINVPKRLVSKRGRNPEGRLTDADAVDFFLDRQFVETCERQAEEQTDAAFEEQVGIAKSAFDLLRSTLGQRGIGNTPMRGHGLAGPDGTHFQGRVVANGKDKIHL